MLQAASRPATLLLIRTYALKHPQLLDCSPFIAIGEWVLDLDTTETIDSIAYGLLGLFISSSSQTLQKIHVVLILVDLLVALSVR